MTQAIIPATTPKSLKRIEREIERDPKLKSPNTRRGYRHDLTHFETWRGERPMTKLLVEEYAAELQRAGRSPNSVNRALAAIRWWARRIGDLAFEGRLPKEEREEIVTQAARVASVGDVKGEREQKGRQLAEGELSALMRACAEDDSPAGTRDAVIIALAWATGARRSELAGLTLADVKPIGEGEYDLTIRGKGDKTRTAYIYNGAASALADWLALRGDDPSTSSGQAPSTGSGGPLFYAVGKGGKIRRGERKAGRKGYSGESFTLNAGMSDEALAQMLAKRAEQAGLSEAVTWHDFRRTFAGNLLDNGADLVTAQKLMGHSSPTTTSNYDRRGDEVKRRAVRSLHVPYTRRKEKPRKVTASRGKREKDSPKPAK